MTHKLTRRGFARLAIAGGVAVSSIGAVTAPFATTIFARSASGGLIGVSYGPKLAGTDDGPAGDSTEFEAPSNGVTGPGAPVPIVLHSLDLTTGQARALPTPYGANAQSALLMSNETITGCTALADGNLVLAVTPLNVGRSEHTAPRLTLLSTPAHSVELTGLQARQQLGDLVATADGRLLGLVTDRSGAAPAMLVAIDTQSGRLSPLESLRPPGYWRISTLTESPGGQLLSTAVTREGETHLLQVGLGRGQTTTLFPLTLNGTVWNNGLQSLIHSTTGEMIAFGALRYETMNALYRVDVRSGTMVKLHDFNAASVAYVHT